MSRPSRKERLLYLGRRYFNHEQFERLKYLIKKDKILAAHFAILRAIDESWYYEGLSDIEAAADYKILGLSKEVAAIARQNSPAHWI